MRSWWSTQGVGRRPARRPCRPVPASSMTRASSRARPGAHPRRRPGAWRPRRGASATRLSTASRRVRGHGCGRITGDRCHQFFDEQRVAVGSVRDPAASSALGGLPMRALASSTTSPRSRRRRRTWVARGGSAPQGGPAGRGAGRPRRVRYVAASISGRWRAPVLSRVIRSSVERSAQWMSSMTRTTGPCAVRRSRRLSNSSKTRACPNGSAAGTAAVAAAGRRYRRAGSPAPLGAGRWLCLPRRAAGRARACAGRGRRVRTAAHPSSRSRQCPTRTRAPLRRRGQPALAPDGSADPRLPTDERGRGPARLGVVERLDQCGELRDPSDERRRGTTTHHGHVTTSSHRAQAVGR